MDQSPTPNYQYNQAPPTPAAPKVNPLLFIGILLVGLAVGGAIGYFVRQPEVDSLRKQPATSQSQQSTPSTGQPQTDQSAKSRDTERATDINSIATQLEVYYNDNGGYPMLTGQAADDAWVKANLVGIDVEVLRAPGAAANSMQDTATPDSSHYGYKAFASDNISLCETAPCATFELYWYDEATGKVKTKSSLN